ncbi:hypothetical protein FRC07_014208, partial [Ceratobasidium sp. 392]
MTPENLYGGTWKESLAEDEAFWSAVKAHLKGVEKYAQAQDVVEFFGTPSGEPFLQIFGSTPSLCTAQDWMGRLGLDWGRERCGQYTDGHEHVDVV